MEDVLAMYQDKATRAEFVARCKEIYERVQGGLELGEGVIAIEPESGDYFAAETLGQANNVAFEKHPDAWMYFTRIEDPNAGLPLKTW